MSHFRLDLSREQLLHYYRGAASRVNVRDEAGRRLQFPASALRPHIGEDGVRGRFRIRFDADNRLIDLRRVAW